MGTHVPITRQLSGLAVRLLRATLGVATAALVTIRRRRRAGRRQRPPTTTTTTLPPLPPQVYAYVTMVGLARTSASVTVWSRSTSLSEGPAPGRRSRVGTFPDAIAVTPDGERAYVTNYASSSVTSDRPAHRTRPCRITARADRRTRGHRHHPGRNDGLRDRRRRDRRPSGTRSPRSISRTGKTLPRSRSGLVPRASRSLRTARRPMSPTPALRAGQTGASLTPSPPST